MRDHCDCDAFTTDKANTDAEVLERHVKVICKIEFCFAPMARIVDTQHRGAK